MNNRNKKFKNKPVKEEISREADKNTFKSVGEYLMSDKINEMVKNFNDTLKPLTDIVISLEKNRFFTKLGEIVIKYENEFTEEKMETRRRAAVLWAEYGWVLYKKMSITDVFNPPKESEVADEIMTKYLDDKTVTEILIEMKSNKYTRSDYINEILFGFQNGKYISSCILLINLIERVVIQYGRDSFYLSESNKDEKFNIRTKKIIAEDILPDVDDEKKYITYVYYKNYKNVLVRLLSTNASNFEDEPNYLVRDFICHGMTNINFTKVHFLKLTILLSETIDVAQDIELKGTVI